MFFIRNRSKKSDGHCLRYSRAIRERTHFPPSTQSSTRNHNSKIGVLPNLFSVIFTGNLRVFFAQALAHRSQLFLFGLPSSVANNPFFKFARMCFSGLLLVAVLVLSHHLLLTYPDSKPSPLPLPPALFASLNQRFRQNMQFYSRNIIKNGCSESHYAR